MLEQKFVVRVGMLYDFKQGKSAADPFKLCTRALERTVFREVDFSSGSTAFMTKECLDHKAEIVQQKLEELNWSILSHPPYSPDVVLSDYYFFRSMQHELTEKRVENVEEVQTWLSDLFNSKTTDLHYVGINYLRA
ncbi:hypothetical protein RB195_017808 [Necator americanus]|uniref:Histone-lysine N-methyltransferase SETMAR n=1 Tax=Necator americanus TaxID=51031 RepID=A0ABR1C6V8_NECAM